MNIFIGATFIEKEGVQFENTKVFVPVFNNSNSFTT